MNSTWDAVQLYILNSLIHTIVNYVSKNPNEPPFMGPKGTHKSQGNQKKISPSSIPPLPDVGPWNALTPYTQNRVLESTQTKFEKLKDSDLVFAFAFG